MLLLMGRASFFPSVFFISFSYCSSSTDLLLPYDISQVRVKCNEDDTVGDLKKLAAAQLGTRPEKLRIQKWYTIYKDHITLEDYEIHDGMGLEL